MSGIVRNGFDGASSQTRSAPLGRRAGLVELDVADAPALERVEEHAGAVVAALGERDRLAGLEQARAPAPSSAPVPEGKRSASPPSSSPSARSAASAVRVGVALVVQLARLAVPVGPDRRAVERLHGEDSSPAAGSRFDAVCSLLLISINSVDKLGR